MTFFLTFVSIFSSLCQRNSRLKLGNILDGLENLALTYFEPAIQSKPCMVSDFSSGIQLKFEEIIQKVLKLCSHFSHFSVTVIYHPHETPLDVNNRTRSTFSSTSTHFHFQGVERLNASTHAFRFPPFFPPWERPQSTFISPVCISLYKASYCYVLPCLVDNETSIFQGKIYLLLS